MHTTAQSLPTGVDRIEGDVSSTVSGDGAGSVDLDVAVIDTGIDLDHPELNVVGGKSCLGTTKGGGARPPSTTGTGTARTSRGRSARATTAKGSSAWRPACASGRCAC